MTVSSEIAVFANKTIAPVHDMLFGQFVEHVGRCINGGIYDPESPKSREDGVRADVLEALHELRPAYIRYPGGCSASYFNWQELVGPTEQRPRAKLYRNRPFGGVPQAAAFGIPEAYSLCRELGAELYLTVNANTQTPEEAANLVEYLNSDKPTMYADLRRSHGREEPYGIKLFSLGNEIYGNWQAGQRSATEYASWCAEAIRQMKWVDPDIRVVVCGLGRPDPEWDRTIMFRLLGLADMISMHNYFGRPVFEDLMAASRICEQMISSANHLLEEVMDSTLGVHSRSFRELGKLPSPRKRPGIAFDEWNLWYRSVHHEEKDEDEIYNYADALATASLLHAILRNGNTIEMANYSLAVNTLSCILTDRERMARQTTWYPQKLIRDTHAGSVVETVVDSPVFSGKHERFFCGIVDAEKAKDDKLPSLLHFDDIPALDVVTSLDREGGKLVISVVQKLKCRPLRAEIGLHGLTVPEGHPVTVHRLTGGDDLLAENTLDHPDQVGIKTQQERWSRSFVFPPASLTIFEVALSCK